MEITKEEFNKYEGVRVSGVTNMFDVAAVIEFSGLEREQIDFIMQNYEELSGKYLKEGIIKCPKCNKQIDKLVTEITTVSYLSLDGTDALYTDGDYLEPSDDYYNCPECDAKLFSNEEDAMSFLKNK